MTSTTNGQAIERINTAKSTVRDRFARQMKLLSQLERAAGELHAVTAKWNEHVAALAKVSGGPAAAAELTGISRAAIARAVRVADREAVDSLVVRSRSHSAR